MLQFSQFLTLRRRIIAVLVVLGLTVAATAPEQRRIGDRLQVALPILALGCEIAEGRGLEYAGRYVVMFIGTHGTKRGLGDTPLNRRPNGGLQGFPSGHTSTAAFGATTLVNSCITNQPIVQGAILLAAAYTGGTRIEAGAHNLIQVMAGAAWGALCSLLFRRGSASARWASRQWRRLRPSHQSS